MPVDIYVSDSQLQLVKDILDYSDVKTYLEIPANVKDDEGVDTGVPNEWGVTDQSPYYLMPNYLPQIVVNVGAESAMDEQFNTGTTVTKFNVYYAFEYENTEPYLPTMLDRLRYIARRLLEFRTDQEFWYSMSFPTIEPDNEYHRYYAEENIAIAVGRVSFEVYHKGTYR